MDFQKLLREETARLLAAANISQPKSLDSLTGESVTENASVSSEKHVSQQRSPEKENLTFNTLELAVQTSAQNVTELDMTNYSVGDSNDLFYVPEYITEAVEERLVSNLQRHPIIKHTGAVSKSQSEAWCWQQLRTRRVLTFRGLCKSKEPVEGESKAREELPTGLPEYMDELFAFLEGNVCSQFPGFAACGGKLDHVLINDYEKGQGIMPHTDGRCYSPYVFCLSLLSPVVITFQEKLKTEEIGMKEAAVLARLVLEPRSLIVFKDDCYTNALHGIKDVNKEVFPVTEITNFQALSAETRDQVLHFTASSSTSPSTSQKADESEATEETKEASQHLEILRRRRMSLTFRHELPASRR